MFSLVKFAGVLVFVADQDQKADPLPGQTKLDKPSKRVDKKSDGAKSPVFQPKSSTGKVKSGNKSNASPKLPQMTLNQLWSTIDAKKTSLADPTKNICDALIRPIPSTRNAEPEIIILDD